MGTLNSEHVKRRVLRGEQLNISTPFVCGNLALSGDSAKMWERYSLVVEAGIHSAVGVEASVKPLRQCLG